MGTWVPHQGDWKHTLYGTDQGEWLVGYDSDDTIYANGGDDIGDGTNGTDIIDGGDGNDTLVGGTGTDYLTGGLGADAFVVNQQSDWEIIYDFHREQGDHLLVKANMADTYTWTVQDGDTFVNFGNGNGVVLVGVTSFFDSDIVAY